MDSWRELPYHVEWIVSAEMWSILPFDNMGKNEVGEEPSLDCVAETETGEDLGCLPDSDNCSDVNMWTQLPFMVMDADADSLLSFDKSEKQEVGKEPSLEPFTGTVEAIECLNRTTCTADVNLRTQQPFMHQDSDSMDEVRRAMLQFKVLEEVKNDNPVEDSLHEQVHAALKMIEVPTGDHDTVWQKLDDIKNSISPKMEDAGSEQSKVPDQNSGHPVDSPEQDQSKTMAEPLLSVKRASSRKFFTDSRYTAEWSVGRSGELIHEDVGLKITAAVNLAVGESSSLSFNAGNIKVVVRVCNQPEEEFRRRLRCHLLKKLRKTCCPASRRPVPEPVPGTCCETIILGHKRMFMESSFVKAPVQTTLELKLNLNCKKTRVSRNVTYSYGGIEIFVTVTNVGPLFRKYLSWKLGQKLKISGSEFWTNDSICGEEGPEPEMEELASPCLDVKPASMWSRFCSMFRCQKASPLMDRDIANGKFRC